MSDIVTALRELTRTAQGRLKTDVIERIMADARRVAEKGGDSVTMQMPPAILRDVAAWFIERGFTVYTGDELGPALRVSWGAGE